MAPSVQNYDVMSLASTSGACHDIRYFPVKMVIAPLHERQRPEKFTTCSHRRTVSFKADSIVHEVLHRNDYTPTELEASWYDREGMRHIKQLAKSEANFWNAGALVNCNLKEMTFRGLEGRISEGARKKLQHRRDAYSSVFSEIAFQKEVDCLDDDMIADAYFLYSEPCAIAAQMMGQRDEMEARRIQENQTTRSDSIGPGFCRTVFVENILDSTMTNKNREGLTATSSSSHVVLSTA